MMIPERIQGATIPYDQRTLSKAVSDDPVRNGISRLDEMMSGAVRSTLRSISYLLYFICLSLILLQIVGVSPRRSHTILTGLFALLCVLQSAGVQGSSHRVSASSCLSCATRGVLEYFVSLYICNNQITSQVADWSKLSWLKQGTLAILLVFPLF